MWLGLVIALGIGSLLAGSSACMNPARDFGPRLALSIFGWHSAFPGLGWGLGGYWWIWWIVPTIGALLAEVIFELVISKSILDNELLDGKNELIEE